jgi:hypothetical protein
MGQQADALLVGDAKQRSTLCASIVAASSAATFESLHVLLGRTRVRARNVGVAVAAPFRSRRARR